MCLGDVVYSPELHGFSVVMGDGKAVFISAKSAKYEPQVKYILFCAYFYAACAVSVTVFSTGRKFQPVLNFM